MIDHIDEEKPAFIPFPVDLDHNDVDIIEGCNPTCVEAYRFTLSFHR